MKNATENKNETEGNNSPTGASFDRKNATMKTQKNILNGKVIPNGDTPCYYNVNMVTDEGSSVSHQTWSDDGSPRRAARRVMERIEGGLDESNSWDLPLVRVYIHCTATKATYEFDLTNGAHLNRLQQMA